MKIPILIVDDKQFNCSSYIFPCTGVYCVSETIACIHILIIIVEISCNGINRVFSFCNASFLLLGNSII